ncbi:MAG: FHA domain-containing protein [Myxococcota bacterium]
MVGTLSLAKRGILYNGVCGAFQGANCLEPWRLVVRRPETYDEPMPSVDDYVERHREALERGVNPAPGPAVLLEGVEGQEKLLPHISNELRGLAWETHIFKINREELALSSEQRRVDQMKALQDLVDGASQVFVLTKRGRNTSPNICVGRAQRNDIVLADQTISSLHAYFEDTGKGWLLADHHSSNGTFVNAEPVETTLMVHNGDCIRFGNRIFYFLSGYRLLLFLDLRVHHEGTRLLESSVE